MIKITPWAGRNLTLDDLLLPDWASSLSPLHPDVVAAHKKQKSQGPSGKMLIIVPFREHAFNKLHERSQQLLLVAATLDKHLRAVGKVPGRDYATLIIEMHDQEVGFNKGYLLNVGVRVAELWGYDYVVCHDADMLPESLENTYDMAAEDDLPVHYSPTINGKYLPYGSHIGGVFAAYTKSFSEFGGFPNNFWGWGWEDNFIMYRMIRHKGFRRHNSTTGTYRVLDHERPHEHVPKGKKWTSRTVPSAENNKNAFYATVARGDHPFMRDDYNSLNATLLRYAPLPHLGAFHWVTASLDSMLYRPDISGLEPAALTEARLFGKLPSLELLGLRTDGTLAIDPPLTAREQARIKAFMALAKPLRANMVTRADRLEELNGVNLDRAYAAWAKYAAYDAFTTDL